MQLNLALALLASSFTGSATAVDPQPADKVRDLTPRQTTNLLSSLIDLANSLGISACLPEAIPLVTELPTIPSGLIGADLISQGVSQTSLALSDICSFSITGSVGTIFTDFLPTAYSWYSAHESQIASIVSGCTSAAKLTSTVEAYATCKAVGTTLAAGGETSASTGSAASQTSAASGSVSTKSQASAETDTSIASNTGLPLSAASPTTTVSSTTDVSGAPSTTATQNLAPRETGLIMAAAAAAGFIGVVAVL